MEKLRGNLIYMDLGSSMTIIFRNSVNGRFGIEKAYKALYKLGKVIILPNCKNKYYQILLSVKYLLKIKDKCIHITGDVHYLVFLLFWKKSILTIHDINHYEDLKGVRKIIYKIIWFDLPMKIAKIIVVISPYTREKILKNFNINRKKIVVIPNCFKEVRKVNLEKDEKYFNILAIGQTQNKNIENLIKAVKDMSDIKITQIGKPNKEMLDILKLNNMKYENYFNISQKDIDIEYNKADMLYFASLKEGFGLPILEAQSIGLPVLTSNISSMPYVAGNGAIYVDPYSIKSIKEGILKIKNSKEDKETIVKNGYKNVNRFKEEYFINNYSKLYKEFENGQNVEKEFK